MRQPLIAPSLLSADFAHLGQAVDMINRSVADWHHCDIMDGHFVPNLSFGLPVLQAIHRHATKPLDVHLMIEQPDRYLEAFAQAGAATLTVHLEACPNLDRTLRTIRTLGCQPGVAINPHTPAEALTEVLPLVDLVIVMGVNPGFGGQSLLPNTAPKVARLKAMRDQMGATARLEVDGGVTVANAADLVAAGADVLVAGSEVFKAADPLATIAQLKQALPTAQA